MQFRFNTGPTMSSCHSKVGTWFLRCSQSEELRREYKESNRKRIDHFDCKGRLTIHIDVPAKEATVKLQHEVLHEKPIDVKTPPEIKQEIKENLHVDPVQLHMHLRTIHDINMVTMKQIHYWWSIFTQSFYKSDEDHIISTCQFFEKNQAANCELCFNVTTSQVSSKQ